ncbi:hypothetical protein evm_013954 [Chilo suppressalis]|nr:hypothetical protein evm_013954 [Chilo suppressalis]
MLVTFRIWGWLLYEDSLDKMMENLLSRSSLCFRKARSRLQLQSRQGRHPALAPGGLLKFLNGDPTRNRSVDYDDIGDLMDEKIASVLPLGASHSRKPTLFVVTGGTVIKSAIEQRLLDDLRSKESAWVRSVLPPDVDVASVLKVLTTESANHRQLTVIGLINLSFSLLSVSGVKAVAHTCWSHGKLVVVRLCKSQPETASHVLGLLSDRLAGETTPKQYAECLFVLCKLTPVSVERCTQLSTILENCRPSGASIVWPRPFWTLSSASTSVRGPGTRWSWSAGRDCILAYYVPTAGAQAFPMDRIGRLVGANDCRCSRDQRLNGPSEAWRSSR